MGTLTLSISNSVHTSISPIFLHKSCSVATPEHSEPLPLEIYVRVVALAPDLRKVPLYGATEFLYHTSTIELLSLLILIKGSYPSFKAHYHAGKSSSALWLLWHANSRKVATRVGTSCQATNDF
jgi:hypothetical protein